ncbi:MAG: VTT domain-containing protein [Planctomycetes bacterium]|nr:VTT domain-containing protein [Planctomycetota bacterium]MCW8134234.1 VTT domain-containing protein [Planctomycetota bacterium]
MDWETVMQYVEQYGYFAVALGTLADQSGLQAFVVAGGVLAGVRENVALWGVVLAGAAGSFTSDAVMYGIGRWRANWLERIVRSEKGRMRLNVLRDGMRRYAFWLLAFGRFLPWIGRFVPAAAGLRKVPALLVLGYSLAGALLSGAFYAMLGFYAAESVRALEEYSLFVWLGALIISFPVAGWLLKRFDRIVTLRLQEQAALATAPPNGDQPLSKP